MNLNMKIIVTGARGQLGYDCVRELKERGYKNILALDKSELDITDEIAVHKIINEYKPDIIMHNAAWTAVDKAETCPDLVRNVNALGTKYIADSCKEVGAKLVYISTDYVFEGIGTKEYEVNDPKLGLSIYGKTKSEGEDFVTSILNKYFIVRISWVFGINGNNFVKTMLKLANSGKKELNVVCDQVGSVTYTYDLSKLLCDMIETDKYGIYHATNEGIISWYDFAVEIFKEAGIDFVNLENEWFDMPFGTKTGAGVIFGASGGVMEAALRYAVAELDPENARSVKFSSLRESKVFKEKTVVIGDKKIRCAVVSGLKNARKLLDDIKAGKDNYDFIEVMSCQGGCVAGAGQPQFEGWALRKTRAEGLYKEDTELAYKSQDNSGVQALYGRILDKIGGPVAHKLLHTHYKSKKYQD